MKEVKKLAKVDQIGVKKADGTYDMYDINHHVSDTVVTNSASGKTNTTTTITNDNVYLNHIENNVVKDSHKIKGTGTTQVTADASGNIIVNSADQYLGTVTQIFTANGVTTTGGSITSSGTIEADLVSKTKLENGAIEATEVSNRVYPVALDKNGKLAANVPWEDTKVTTPANHYSPGTASGQNKTATAAGATSDDWGTNVVKGVIINTDGKGHITGLSVESSKIPANPGHKTSKNIINRLADDTTDTAAELTNGNVKINHLEDSTVTSSHEIVGAGAAKVTAKIPQDTTSPKIEIGVSASDIVSTLGTTAVNRATADASGNTITSTYVKKTDIVDTYSSTGTSPVDGKAIAAAINTLDVNEVGGTNKYISKISETDGKISATAGNIDTAVTSGSSNLITSGAVSTAITNAIDNLPEPMIFKGTVGTGGTITTLPTASASNEGHTYKVLTAGTYAGQVAKVGDTFISTGSDWAYIPSGDEPSGTVTSVGLTQGTGISVSGSPITSSGNITVSHADTSSVTNTSNTGRTYITNLEFDGMGHVTKVSSGTETVVNTDTSVTSSANHYTPTTASGQNKTASASEGTAAWGIDVVQGVTLNTDGKGHVTGLSVTSGKIPSNPTQYTNQNAFSNVKVTKANETSTTIAADTTTDTVELVEGGGITLTSDTTNDKLTIANSGVRSVITGTSNGTISVNTNGTSENIAVKGLGSAAYTESSAYATASHNQASNTITAMTGYSKPSTVTTTVVAATDSLNTAIGKIEKALDGKGTSSLTIGTSAGTALEGNTKYAGSSIAGGSATSAIKLDSTNVGSGTKGVYFDSTGKPAEMTYSVSKNVPSNAEFTDTKVTSTANHYTPETDSQASASASATGGSASWNTSVVSGVTLNTDGKGHVTGISVSSTKIPSNPNTDTSVTSSANHYTPSTASGSDKSASASGATAAWGIDVVKGVTLNTDGKGHVTGISVTSGKIPGEPGHYSSKNVLADSATGTADKKGTANGSVKLNHLEQSTVTSTHAINGTGATKVITNATSGALEIGTSASDIVSTLGTTAVNRAAADASGNTISSTYVKSADIASTYSSTGTSAVNGKAVAAALGTLDVSEVGGTNKYIFKISETDGKISATAGNIDTTVTSGSSNLVTSGAVSTAITNAIDNLPEPMVFKGSLGTGGTITALPTAASSNEGHTYKVITTGTYSAQSAKVGDTFISDGSSWILIPSGDEPSGTVTSVATGAGLTGGTITSSGTVKANLVSETKLTNAASAATETAGRVYPVAIDKNSKLAVNIPWTDNNTTYTFASGTNGFTVTPSGGSAQTVTVTPSITNNVTGSGTNGKLTKWNGANTITDGPTLSSAISTQTTSTKFLREDGTWSAPSYIANTDRYVNSASFADNTTNSTSNPVKMTLTRAGSDTTSVTASIPKVSSSSAGVVPKGAAVSTQSQSTKFLREDGSWAAPSYTTNTDTSVTSSANHYTPSTASGSDKTASASGATAAWSIDVVKGVTLNTDGKGHVTGISVTSGKIPANPNTDRYVNSASFADVTSSSSSSPLKMTLTRAGSDSSTVTANLPKVSSSSAGVAPKGAAVSSQSQTTKFLREDGTWAAPTYTINTDTDVRNTAGATDTSSKIYLVGATSQGANPQTYSDNEVYTTSGVLTTKSIQVGGGSATLQYNSTTQSVDFVFA